MAVTLYFLSAGALLVTAIVALSVIRYRKLDAALKSLGAAFKLD